MRKSRAQKQSSLYRIMLIDDEVGIIDSLSALFKRTGYIYKGFVNPLDAIEELKVEKYDMLILDFLMSPIHGDEVVKRIREFNDDIYILLLTGHKDLAPPLDTIRELEIQGYCEKSDRFDQLLLLVESGIKSISQLQTIKKFKDGLNSILQAVPKIYQLQPIGNILEEILSQIMPLVDSQNAFILIDDLTEMGVSNKSIFEGIGDYNVDIENFMDLLDPTLIESIGSARSSSQVMLLDQGVILPLVNEYNQSIGIIFSDSKDTDEGLKLLEIYANQAASSLNNAFLHSMVNTQNDLLNKYYEQLKTRYMDTIEALRQVVDAKDYYTRGHSDRVAFYAVKLSKLVGMSETDLENVKISGFFHDIGKIGTSDDILLKNDKLTDKEYVEIKKHPLKGAHILSAVSMFKDVVPIIKSHHERIDGKGYPQGLKGDQIPYLARVISIADSFDAMMSDRTYRSKLKLDEAKSQLGKGAGTQFDEKLVEVFIKMLDDYDAISDEIAYSYE